LTDSILLLMLYMKFIRLVRQTIQQYRRCDLNLLPLKHKRL